MTDQQKDVVRKKSVEFAGKIGRPGGIKASCRGWGYHARNEGLS
jgi:hypothetical protein